MVKHAALVDWKARRKDTKTELYWNNKGVLTSSEEYQKKWNFREVDYSEAPSNNGLDTANLAFAFDKKLAKCIKIIEVDV